MSLRVFDTDALTEILAGDAAFAERLAAIPPSERAITIVTVEEILGGRMAAVRRAEGRGKPPLPWAYERLWEAYTDLRRLPTLPYDQAAHAVHEAIRPAVRHKVGVHDLRIAAITLSVGGVVVTRNRRDFERIPGLAVEFWP